MRFVLIIFVTRNQSHPVELITPSNVMLFRRCTVGIEGEIRGEKREQFTVTVYFEQCQFIANLSPIYRYRLSLPNIAVLVLLSFLELSWIHRSMLESIDRSIVATLDLFSLSL